jgi:hypothetical protein
MMIIYYLKREFRKEVEEMKKIISVSVSLAILMLPLISYAVSQSTFDWSGGPQHSHNMVLSKTLSEISEKAAHDAYLYGLPVEYKTEDGSMVLKAFPDYGKSKCDLIHVKAFERGKFVMNTVKEVCDRNYELETPYVPNLGSIPSPQSIPRVR